MVEVETCGDYFKIVVTDKKETYTSLFDFPKKISTSFANLVNEVLIFKEVFYKNYLLLIIFILLANSSPLISFSDRLEIFNAPMYTVPSASEMAVPISLL